MNVPLEARIIEEQVLAHHASLKTLAINANAESAQEGASPSATKTFEEFTHSSGFEPLTSVTSVTSVPSDLKPLYQGVFSACTKLEFIQLDCEIIANAWVRQVMRLGAFDAKVWPTKRDDFGLAPFKTQFAPCPQDLGLYAVLPDSSWIKRMAHIGVPTLQLRFKSEDPKLIEKEIELSIQAVNGSQSKLFINDHWKYAIKHGAYGVHLGQEDIDVLTEQDWAQMKASGLRLGISTHGYSEMIRADALRPSYIAMGAIYPTTLKKMQTPPQGLGRLAQYAGLMKDYPLVAIGGITEEDFPNVLKTGVGSVAVVRAIVQSNDPENKAKALCKLVNATL